MSQVMLNMILVAAQFCGLTSAILFMLGITTLARSGTALLLRNLARQD